MAERKSGARGVEALLPDFKEGVEGVGRGSGGRRGVGGGFVEVEDGGGEGEAGGIRGTDEGDVGGAEVIGDGERGNDQRDTKLRRE